MNGGPLESLPHSKFDIFDAFIEEKKMKTNKKQKSKFKKRLFWDLVRLWLVDATKARERGEVAGRYWGEPGERRDGLEHPKCWGFSWDAHFKIE